MANGVEEEGIFGELVREEARHADGERYAFAIPRVAPREGRRFEGVPVGTREDVTLDAALGWIERARAHRGIDEPQRASPMEEVR